jgi:hypothetical protein
MNDNPQAIADEWAQNLDRWIFIIDEKRVHNSTHKELVIFGCIALKANTLIDMLLNLQNERKLLPTQSAEAPFKGSKLYGPKAKPTHEGIRKSLSNDILKCENFFYMTSSQLNLKSLYSLSTGKLTTIDKRGKESHIKAQELMPLLSFIKYIANSLQVGNQQIDVIFDRSAQTGTSPDQRAITKEIFEVFLPDKFNTLSDGSLAKIQCDSSFKIILACDKGKTLRDALLIPDCICYLFERNNLFNKGINKVISGEKIWVEPVSISEVKKVF